MQLHIEEYKYQGHCKEPAIKVKFIIRNLIQASFLSKSNKIGRVKKLNRTETANYHLRSDFNHQPQCMSHGN